MEKKVTVQLVYHDNSLTISWNSKQVSSDVAVEAFNKLGMKIAEYFKTTTLYFIVSLT
jgi:hypothetical protein